MPSADHAVTLEGDEVERPLLVKFADLWSRELADAGKLWQLFDLSEMYLHRPDHFGAPLFTVTSQLVSPVFSSQDTLARFMLEEGPTRDGPPSKV